jgi:DNA-binding MarR family transcriptional regulator
MVQTINDPLAIANELRPVLLRIIRHLRRETQALGITGGQVSLLAAIDLHPGLTAGDLAAREGISAPGMSGHLAKLEGGKYIHRSRGTDRRRVGLYLTPEGTNVLNIARGRRTAWLAERLEQLSPEERAAIVAALGALAHLSGEEEI